MSMRWHCVAGCAAALLTPAVQAQPEFPPGFRLQTVATGFSAPTALAFDPDGRLYVTEQRGAIRVIEPGGAVRDFAQIDVYSENENGLLGLALDPAFATNGYVYVFATVSRSESQILRFTARDGVGEERAVIRDFLPTRGGFHSGGGLQFGPDGMLYFAIGDNEIPENGQDLATLAGKISRIRPDGDSPDDNPFVTPTGTPRATFALGFRNPFRFCFAPDGRLFALDVGSNGDERREEINLVRAGGNYGWPVAEGKSSADVGDGFVDPIFSYHEGGAAPVGAVYYSGSQFPEAYSGSLFHLEFVLSRLYRLTLDGDQAVAHETFAQLEGGPLDLVQGPDGALYYCEYYGGRIQKIDYAAASADGAAPADEGEAAPASETDAFEPAAEGLCGFAAGPALFLAGLVTLSMRRR